MIPKIMGIVNVTPDSFSDGGRFVSVDEAVAHARTMIAEGADVLDVGGESTRPGAQPITIDTELERVIPVVDALAALGTRVSIDTRHEEVAREAVAKGATIINDVSASLWPVAAELQVGWIAMHMAGEPATMQDNPSYDNVVREVEEFLLERGEAASAAGVNEVWIDPGFGFGKTLDQNVQLVASLDSFTAQRFPVVLGVSRKNSLGRLAARADTGRDEPVTGPQDRLEPALAMGVWAALSGVDMLRVHDVAPHVRALRVVESTTELPVRSGLMTVEPPALGAA